MESLAGTSESLIVAGSGTTQATLDTIRDTYANYDYLLDPHTAVGVTVAREQLDAAEPMLCLATAHPAKFSDAIEQAVGEDLAHHPQLDALVGKATRFEVLPALEEEVRELIRGQIPMARLGSAEEVADAVTFLVSPQASYITGQVLHVNGGLYV